MELFVVLGLGGLIFIGLSLSRGHWFRLADSLYRLGPGALRPLGWPTAHPFSNVDPNADGQGGALGIFPVRRTRLRVLLHGLPVAELPDAARHHGRWFRLWAMAVAVMTMLAVAAIHPVGALAIPFALILARCVVPRWSTTPNGEEKTT